MSPLYESIITRDIRPSNITPEKAKITLIEFLLSIYIQYIIYYLSTPNQTCPNPVQAGFRRWTSGDNLKNTINNLTEVILEVSDVGRLEKL